MAIHVRTWSGSRSATITEMTNAGRRGKRCRVLRIEGCAGDPWSSDEPWAKAVRHSQAILGEVARYGAECDFDVVAARVGYLVGRAREEGVPEGHLGSRVESIRGIDAPRAVLTAGVEGKWSASIDENGVHLRDLNDVNEWTEITAHGQSRAEAYRLAASVWAKVEAATTRRDASHILSAAGCRLHGYCAMD
jgi:hypothetical protein